MAASTLVSARVPKNKKDDANEILSSIGATTSDLINDAFDYLLAQRRLPSASLKTEAPTGNMDQFKAFVASSTLDIAWGGHDVLDDKRILEEGKQADYEALA